MKIAKWLIALFLVYAGLVFTFESLLGYFQPAGQGTLVITTSAEDGSLSDRVLAHLESDGQLYVAANHWPRTWYTNALANPNVHVSVDGVVHAIGLPTLIACIKCILSNLVGVRDIGFGWV